MIWVFDLAKLYKIKSCIGTKSIAHPIKIIKNNMFLLYRTYIYFIFFILFFQSCSVWRWSCVQSRSVLMETRASAHCVSVMILSLPPLMLWMTKIFTFLPYDSWSGGHIKWGQSFRIRHITTGRYLCLDEEKGLLLVDPEKAVSKMSAFCFRISKVIIVYF